MEFPLKFIAAALPTLVYPKRGHQDAACAYKRNWSDTRAFPAVFESETVVHAKPRQAFYTLAEYFFQRVRNSLSTPAAGVFTLRQLTASFVQSLWQTLWQSANSADRQSMKAGPRVSPKVKTTVALGIALFLASINLARAETYASQPASRMARVLGLLHRVETGKKLITEAKQKLVLKDDYELLNKLTWASASKTSRTLIREWDPQTGLEFQKSVLSIALKQGQDDGSLLLDLAHELTHAVRGPAWDPYDPDLTVSRYVTASIEGSGGEVDAVEQECQVAQEWMLEQGGPAGSVRLDHVRCDRYGAGALSREKIKQDFYRVGSWKRSIQQKIDESVFERLSDEPPQLISSTGLAPYPVALIEEYEQMNEKACENTARRLQPTAPTLPDETIKTFLARRCGQMDLQAAPLR